MNTVQMMLWEEETPDPVVMEMHALKEAQSTMRRAFYKKFAEVAEELKTLRMEIAILRKDLKSQK